MLRAQTLVSEDSGAQVVTLAQAKDHLCIVVDDQDDRIWREVDAAISASEDFLRRPLRRGSYQKLLDRWEIISGRYAIRLLGYVSAVTSIEYRDSNGTYQTIASSVYESLIDEHSTLIREAPNQSWPELQEYVDNVRVTASIGWLQSDVPFAVQQGALMMLSYIHDSDDSAKMAAHSLLAPWRLSPW